MQFRQTPDGKTVFLSIDSRLSHHNPLYTAWKAKSFTDGDITLHFILFDILYAPEVVLSLNDIMGRMDEYLRGFRTPKVFDTSTVRKKLNEYIYTSRFSADVFDASELVPWIRTFICRIIDIRFTSMRNKFISLLLHSQNHL